MEEVKEVKNNVINVPGINLGSLDSITHDQSLKKHSPKQAPFSINRENCGILKPLTIPKGHKR